MKPIGKWLTALLAGLMLAAPAMALLEARVDRARVAMGESLRLTISATGGDTTNQLNIGPLYKDFEIIQRSTSNSTQIINGRRTQTRQVILEITPKREGTLQIPPLRSGRSETNMLLIAVGPAPEGNEPGQTVLFEAEVDRDSVYVQGQLILTLRIQQAINLESRSVSELQLDNAFVKQLEQKSFQRSVDGRPWLVHEIRYAIFPEQSGTFTIPEQTFSARQSVQRRSLFDSSSGPLLRRNTEAISVEVLPRPEDFPGSTWLPAQNLQIEESWSTPPEGLRVGESTTRTLRISGEGLQGAQLPPVQFRSSEGLKYYPDQPQISDAEFSSGLLGTRVDSAALVPTAEGSWEIPELRIPWFDAETGQTRYAVVPARTLEVKAAPGAAPEAPALPATTGPASVAETAVAARDREVVKLWQRIAAFSLLGWLLTLLYLFFGPRRSASRKPIEAKENLHEGKLFRELCAACASNQPAEARRLLLGWYNSMSERPLTSLTALGRAVEDNGLRQDIRQLDTALYAGDGSSWNGDSLQNTCKRLRKNLRKRSQAASSEELALYPGQAASP